MRHCPRGPHLIVLVFSVFLMIFNRPAAAFAVPDSLNSQENTVSSSETDTLSSVPDSISPKKLLPYPVIHQTPLSGVSEFLTYPEIDSRNISSFAEISALQPLANLFSFGTPVYREHVSLFGSYPGEFSCLSNGLEMNNNSFTGYDQAVVLTEEIDSIEYIPAPRSFLYSADDNLSAINILRKDRISTVPVTKIKYYEGPFGEAMFDARFNQFIYNRINISFDIMNRKTDDRYTNSAGSVWSGRISADYYFSEKFNAGISYTKTKTDINHYGGVDTDSVNSAAALPDEVIYDELNAPVNDEYLYDKVSTENITAVLKAKQGEILSHTLTVFSKSYLREYRDNFTLGVPDVYIDFEEKRTGGFLQTTALFSPITFNIGYRFENRKNTLPYTVFRNPLTIPSLPEEKNQSLHVLTGEAGINLAGVALSAFYKTGLAELTGNSGYGADARYQIDDFELYAGYGSSNRRYNYAGWNNSTGTRQVTQIRASYKTENTKISLQGFYATGTQNSAGIIPLGFETGAVNPFNRAILGAGIAGSLKTGYILSELTFNHTNSKDRSQNLLAPSMSGKVGLYYVNIHFDSNLVVKSGIEAGYRGSYSNLSTDFLTNRLKVYAGTTPSAFTLDFFTSGKIAGRATVFFLWENILDTGYYQMYLYPMPSRGITFGINWEMFN